MADIQEIYSILLSRGYQDQLFSALPGAKKKGRETVAECPLCHKPAHFSYSSQKPVWRCWSCGEAGDWVKYLEKTSGYDFQRALVYLAEIAGVEVSPQTKANYQAYTRRADILETAQDIFVADLINDPRSQPVLDYLIGRGYTTEDIIGMELGAYLDRKRLQDKLSGWYPGGEVKWSGILTPGFGDAYQLTLLWRDQAGRAIGIVGRSVLPEGEQEKRGLSKYKYSFGMQKDEGLIGLTTSRGSDQIVIVEGVLDALYLNHKGFKSVAVGGTSLSPAQIKALETAGTKELLLALDMDQPGQKATEKMIRDLKTSRLRAYVVSWPAEYKDPDELIRKTGPEAFQDALTKAESWSKWIAKRIASRHDLQTDRGLDQALEEALTVYADIEDRIEKRGFIDSLKSSTGLSEEDLAKRLEEATQKASVKLSQSVLQRSLQDLQQKTSESDITGAEQVLTKALREVRLSRGVEPPDPYLLEDLTEDLINTPPALSTGYQKLDDTARIPVGALTIIAGRPGHGKTTFQLNLLAHLLRTYPDKAFYFFSYEEARKAIATKLIMILAGEILQAETNYGAYINYIKEKRGTNKKIEQAIKEYESWTSTGRLLISDTMAPVEDLASVISLLTKERDTGAVIVDYIQKIPLLRPAQSQRYLDLKIVSSLLLEQAVTQDIPLILGSQLNRAVTARQEKRPRLEDMRESGDIEQDANLVIGLYTEAIEKLEEEGLQANTRLDPEVDLQISVLKNRAGVAGRSYSLTFNRPILTIRDKNTGARGSRT
jgi:DNA primase